MPLRRSARLELRRQAAARALAELQAAERASAMGNENAAPGALYRPSGRTSRRLRSRSAPQPPAPLRRRRIVTRSVSAARRASNQRRGGQRASSNARRPRGRPRRAVIDSRRPATNAAPTRGTNAAPSRSVISAAPSSSAINSIISRAINNAALSPSVISAAPSRASVADLLPNGNNSSMAEEVRAGISGSWNRRFYSTSATPPIANHLSFGQPPLNSPGAGPSRGTGNNEVRPSSGRLRREHSDFMREPPDGCSVEVLDDDFFHWRATIMGPPDTPYEGGQFILDIIFPMAYPFLPPHVTFLTKIYHCNITNAGHICLDILNLQWSPVLTVAKVLLSIISLLADPNPNDPLDAYIAHLYKHDRTQHDFNARVWTSRYARPN